MELRISKIIEIILRIRKLSNKCISTKVAKEFLGKLVICLL